MQFWYLVFQMLLLPIVLLAAYVGWALPDIYINRVTQSQAQGVDSFLTSLGGKLSISNPLQASLAEEAEDNMKGEATESSTIADALRQAKQVRVDASGVQLMIRCNVDEQRFRLQTNGLCLAARPKSSGTNRKSCRRSVPTYQASRSRPMQRLRTPRFV